jgi:hypothetical protein
VEKRAEATRTVHANGLTVRQSAGTSWRGWLQSVTFIRQNQRLRYRQTDCYSACRSSVECAMANTSRKQVTMQSPSADIPATLDKPRLDPILQHCIV